MISKINNIFFFFNIILIVFIVYNFFLKKELFQQPEKNSLPLDFSNINLCDYDESKGSKSRNTCYNECLNHDIMCNKYACKEKCFDEEKGNWVNSSCSFKPYGDTKFSCTKICTKKANCNYMICSKLCEECNNKENCPWYKTNENNSNQLVLQTLPEPDSEGRPLPPVINSNTNISSEIGKVNISFAMPFKTVKNDTKVTIDTDTIDNDINYYMYLVKKRDSNGPIRIGTYYLSSDDKKKRQEYNSSSIEEPEEEEDNKLPEKNIPFIKCTIDDLDPEIFYDIIFRSYNNKHLSKDSNILTIKSDSFDNLPRNNNNLDGTITIDKDNINELIPDIEPNVCPK